MLYIFWQFNNAGDTIWVISSRTLLAYILRVSRNTKIDSVYSETVLFVLLIDMIFLQRTICCWTIFGDAQVLGSRKALKTVKNNEMEISLKKLKNQKKSKRRNNSNIRIFSVKWENLVAMHEMDTIITLNGLYTESSLAKYIIFWHYRIIALLIWKIEKNLKNKIK